MRGIPSVFLLPERHRRIIPAHAGNTLVSQLTLDPPEDHPRSCGEYRAMRDPFTDPGRIIPAHAGNTTRYML